MSTSAVILLYVLYNVVYAAGSLPLGGLSDRVGQYPLVIAGYVVFAAVYAGFAAAGSGWTLAVLFAAYGLYIAATEGTSKALIGRAIPTGERASALGLYYTATGLAAFAASTVGGLLWSAWGPWATFAYGAAAAVAAAAPHARRATGACGARSPRTTRRAQPDRGRGRRSDRRPRIRRFPCRAGRRADTMPVKTGRISGGGHGPDLPGLRARQRRRRELLPGLRGRRSPTPCSRPPPRPPASVPPQPRRRPAGAGPARRRAAPPRARPPARRRHTRHGWVIVVIVAVVIAIAAVAALLLLPRGEPTDGARQLADAVRRRHRRRLSVAGARPVPRRRRRAQRRTVSRPSRPTAPSSRSPASAASRSGRSPTPRTASGWRASPAPSSAASCGCSTRPAATPGRRRPTRPTSSPSTASPGSRPTELLVAGYTETPKATGQNADFLVYDIAAQDFAPLVDAGGVPLRGVSVSASRDGARVAFVTYTDLKTGKYGHGDRQGAARAARPRLGRGHRARHEQGPLRRQRARLRRAADLPERRGDHLPARRQRRRHQLHGRRRRRHTF